MTAPAEETVPHGRPDGYERRTVAAAVSATVIAALPVFLLGGLSVQVRAELGFGAAGLGLAISSSFAASAVASLPAGRLAERHGPRRTMAAGVLAATVSLVGVAAAARSVGSLAAFLAVGGTGNALAQIGANLGLARGVAARRQGLAFGVKQSAVPVATLLAGLSVPAVALTVGWRWAYAVAAAAALPVLLLLPPDRPDRPDRPDLHPPPATGQADAPVIAPGSAGPAAPALPGRTSTAPLVVISLGGVLAAGAAGALGGFLVAWSVESGIEPSDAGLLMALGSVIGLAGRLVDGVLADRRHGGHLIVVSLQLAAGALGLGLLATGFPPALLVGTVLGYGLGWSWPGLLNYAVVRLNRAAPATATSVTQTGIFVGAGGGPLVFGLVVTRVSYPFAWACAAISMLGAGTLMLVARRMILQERGQGGGRGGT